ncbi:MAG: hypothetical protein AAB212_10525 [Bacteroidota bacterium]|mgnify:CR=1 FL=1
MKVYDYIIVFKSPDYAIVDMISRLMLMFSIATLGYSLTYTISNHGFKDFNRYNYLFIALIAGMLGWWIYCYYRQKKGHMPFYRFGLLLATIGWGVMAGPGIITILYFLAVISEKQVKFPQEVAFDDTGIIINSLPKKSYTWSQIANVVLKDGLLTIDFKNNKLIQKAIESQTSVKEELEFNEFCISRLNA